MDGSAYKGAAEVGIRNSSDSSHGLNRLRNPSARENAAPQDQGVPRGTIGK